MAKKKRGATVKPPKKVKLPKEVTFDYLKGNFYRVILATGVHGGPTPNGKYLALSFFNERAPIPKSEFYELSGEGHIGGTPKRREMRQAVVREVEATIMLDQELASRLRDWLTALTVKPPESDKKSSG